MIEHWKTLVPFKPKEAVKKYGASAEEVLTFCLDRYDEAFKRTKTYNWLKKRV